MLNEEAPWRKQFIDVSLQAVLKGRPDKIMQITWV